jgi:hypothetical protein
MQSMYYVGLDVHKKTISYCVKDVSGNIHSEGAVAATRLHLNRWMKSLPQPWTAAMEATVFTGRIYDHLKPHAAALKVRASADAGGHRGGKEEERPHRCQQDSRLPALRFSAGVLHGLVRHSRAEAHLAIATCWCGRWCN